MVDNSYVSVFLVCNLHIFKRCCYVYVVEQIPHCDLLLNKIKYIKTRSLVSCIVWYYASSKKLGGGYINMDIKEGRDIRVHYFKNLVYVKFVSH